MLRDLVYFDFEKTASIFSQVEGGLLREIQSGVESTKEKRRIGQVDLKLFKPEFGGVATEKTSQLESRVLHHDLLVRVERSLFSSGVAVDLNAVLHESDATAELIRSKLAQASYVRAEGWVAIEDYDRINHIAGNFNDIAEFIGRCAMESAQQTEDYKQMQAQLDAVRAEANAEGDRNKKARTLSKLSGIESKFRQLLQQTVELSGVDDWLIEGLRLWIDTFMPGRINLRVYPFESVPEFQILANLKRGCFVDADLENVLFAYGPRPNVKLTVFGLITSMPPKDGHLFDTMQEFERLRDEDLTDEAGFEKGFRGLFGGMEALEKFMRFSHYPNVTVHPLAVYRTIRTPLDSQPSPATAPEPA